MSPSEFGGPTQEKNGASLKKQSFLEEYNAYQLEAGELEKADEELINYNREMKDALADLVVEAAKNSGVPASLKELAKEIIEVSGIFMSMLSTLRVVEAKDFGRHFQDEDITDLQEKMDQMVAKYGLQPEKFSLSKFKKLIRRQRIATKYL